MEKYTIGKIGTEIMKTALGVSYYGNALRVAKDIPQLTEEERHTLDIALTKGVSSFDTRMCLQQIAITLWKIESEELC